MDIVRRVGLGMVLLALVACTKTDGNRTPAELYKAHCAACHNESGRGNFLKAIPSNKDTAKSYIEIVRLVQGHDRPEGSKMPNFDDLPEAEVRLIASYLIELKQREP